MNAAVELPDGSRRRVYLYGRRQAEANREADAARERLEQGAPSVGALPRAQRVSDQV